MKKYISILSTLFALSANAQQPFMDAEIIEQSDLCGTARYVGMGGALGALGAEISASTTNPAAIALYRRNEIKVTAGALWTSDPSAIGYYSRAKGTFDQAGIVSSFHLGSKSFNYFNLSFNYQKKMNFHNVNRSFADTGGATQLDQIAGMLNNDDRAEHLHPGILEREGSFYDLYGMPVNGKKIHETTSAFGGLLQREDKNKKWGYAPELPLSTDSKIERERYGSLNAFDINLSGNIHDRYFVGITIGVNNLSLTENVLYSEARGTDVQPYDYTSAISRRTTGYGMNFKFGTIIRPIEDSPFRFGIAIETPTWYKLNYSEQVMLSTKYDNTVGKWYPRPGEYSNYALDDYVLPYTLRSPWRVRASLGHTFGSYLAFGAEYEYASYSSIKQGYPDVNRVGGSVFNYDEDYDLTAMSKDALKGQHNLRVGAEIKPTDKLSLRIGYNMITSIYTGQGYDPERSSQAVCYNLYGTSWVTYGDTHIFTLGAGYAVKRFVFDVAYKYRNQSATYYTSLYTPSMPLDLARHSIVCTLGVRF